EYYCWLLYSGGQEF
nr:immunoglobulin light chain junction region [Macaca mulatta]MOX45554.1 immunoglobulin light chain junction region [Macaca mulatta]MOX46345.1 immunoglobulin light chain junction region [Macaca mulatta]